MRFIKASLSLVMVILSLFVITGFNFIFHSAYAQGNSIQINADGATFPYPIILKWADEYNKLHPNIQFNYQALGSGTGVKHFLDYQTDFGASDAPLSKTESVKAGDVLHIPETIGADVVAYNIPGIQTGMNLTGKIIADIYQGKITNWNDTSIQDINQGMKLPDQPITTVHRSDGSGTTFVFTDFLSRSSVDWNTFIGKGKTVSWPTGVGSPQNEGVANSVNQTPYSIGYIELAYALQRNMTYAHIMNAQGSSFVAPTMESIQSAASNGIPMLPSSDGDWSQVSIINSQGDNSYPISSMTYFLVHQNLEKVPGMTREKAKEVVNLINWIITDGQQFSPSLEYAPLPDGVKQKDIEGLAMIKYNGESLMAETTPEFDQIVPIIFIISIIVIITITHNMKTSKY
ncbi:MAG: phosphate ABC transporter substrate-binding protein PstS [Thaumarchaeota archaeon]|nr:phosphate ABC transporter substrate-binding protein PstS [Nitrososphaerota archaeon]